MTLTHAHRQMLCHDSGIAEAILTERGYRSLTSPEALVTLPKLGFSTPVARLGPGLLFPLTLPDDPVPLYQFRPDRPRKDEHGDPIKYEIPSKRSQRLILHARAIPALRAGTTPLYVTEGAKKVDSLLSRGATAVGGIGVWSFTVKRSALEKKRGVPKVLLPDWDQIALQGRQVIICFDSDAALNTDVDQAEAALGALLRARGAQVSRVRLPAAPDGTKQGIDDFFAHGHALADVEALVQPLPRPRFDTINASTLYAHTPAPVRWAIPGKLPVGATLFWGRSKDGKSLMVWNIAMAVATGGKALGAWDVEQGDVLYLALEDGERRGHDRLLDQMLHAGMTEPPTRLDLRFWNAPRIGEGFMECLETWIDDHPEGRLVIVDILEKVRPPRTQHGVYMDDYRALEALQQFGQQHNIAILVVHHSNKGKSDDFRDSANGSQGLTGACDTLWSLHRTVAAPDAVLKLISREFDKHDLALRFQDGFWSVLGDAAIYRLSKESQEVIDALTQAGTPLTPKQLGTMLAIPIGTVRVRLKRMLARGEVLNQGEGYFPRASSSPSPSASPERGEKEEEKKAVTPVTECNAVMGVTGVTLGQNGTEMPLPNPDEALQRYRGVTPPPVTPLTSLTPGNDCGYSNGVASVTGVTPCTPFSHENVKSSQPVDTNGVTSEKAEKLLPEATIPTILYCALCDQETERWDDQGIWRCGVCYPRSGEGRRC